MRRLHRCESGASDTFKFAGLKNHAEPKQLTRGRSNGVVVLLREVVDKPPFAERGHVVNPSGMRERLLIEANGNDASEQRVESRIAGRARRCCHDGNPDSTHFSFQVIGKLNHRAKC